MIREFDRLGYPVVVLETGMERVIVGKGAKLIRSEGLRHTVELLSKSVRPEVTSQRIYRKPFINPTAIDRSVDAMSVRETSLPSEYTVLAILAVSSVMNMTLPTAVMQGVSRDYARVMLETYHSSIPNEDSWHS